MSDTPSARAPLFLEDFTVGQRFATASATLDTPAIKAFACQFDPQPFHLDEAAAEESFFGGLVASGWHTAATTMRLLVTSGIPISGGVIGAGGSVKWPRATRPGDTLSVRGEVTKVARSRSNPSRGTVDILAETINQHGEPVQIMTATLVVPCRIIEPS